MQINLEKYRGVPRYAKETPPHVHAYSSYTGRSIERRQLDNCYEAVAETVDYLYGEFTPTRTEYASGTRPLLQMIVEKVCANCATDRDRAIALVRWRRANVTHLGKCGLGTEEEILLGGYSMCHDAARTLIALCQVAGMGARMIVGLNDELRSGHTLAEVYVDGGWAVFDPTPAMPWAFYEKPDTTLASAWDLKQDPTIQQQCQPEFSSDKDVSVYFRNFRIANYSLEESTENMAQRFLRIITSLKVLDNYDYTGHLRNTPLASFVDLDKTVEQWLDQTLD